MYIHFFKEGQYLFVDTLVVLYNTNKIIYEDIFDYICANINIKLYIIDTGNLVE